MPAIDYHQRLALCAGLPQGSSIETGPCKLNPQGAMICRHAYHFEAYFRHGFG